VRNKDEVSLRRASLLLGIHYQTAKAWVKTERLPYRLDLTGHYWIPRWWIDEILNRTKTVQSIQP
jgi:predicted site-specific integrase-resolvase